MCSNFARQLLTNDGIYIEIIQSKHLDQLYELFQLNRNYLHLNINGIECMQTKEDVFSRWGKLKDNSFSLGIWLDESQMIGRCRLTRNDQTDCADIGYWLSESHQGRGIMTAAVRICVQFAFEKWDVERVEIHCGETNLKSRAIPERLGFLNEGKSLSYPSVQINGQMVQSIVYSKRSSMKKIE